MKRKFKKFSWLFALSISAGVFVYSVANLVGIFSEYKRGTDEYEDLKQYTETVDVKEETTDTGINSVPEQNTGVDIGTAPIQVNFDELLKINSDTVGWLKIEGVPSIDYPIVKGTDNSKYLKTTFENKSNIAGAIFMDYTNNSDFSDSHTVIYGHNMKNGSMFGYLKTLRNESVCKNSPYFWICTPNGDYKYEIFSVHSEKNDSETYKLLFQPDEKFENYIEQMKEKSEVKFDVPVTKDDKIVTLSTCTSDDSYRFVVQGKRLN